MNLQNLNKIKFELTGYNIDNLIKLLQQKKVVLFDVKKENLTVSFFVLENQSKIVARYIKNFKHKQSLTKIKQIPFFLLANIGVILGVFIGCMFFLISSKYTWRIEIFGLKDLTKNEIITVLQNNNVKVGKINTQTSEDIETILLNNYDRIAQVSVIKQGTAIIINLSEKLVYTEQSFNPITAKYNGIITKINLITGTPNVKVGDYVNAGDVLVLPFNLVDNKKISVKPLAEIEAEIYILGSAKLDKTEQVLVRTGKKQLVYNYKLFNWNIFSGKNKNSFALFDKVVYNENVSSILPFKRQVECYYELKIDHITNDFDLKKQELIDESVKIAHQNLPMGKILNSDTNLILEQDKMLAITKITLQGIIND